MSGFVEGLCSTTRDRPGSSGCLRRQGPSIMHISGCLGRAGAEHHAHQRVSGELQIQSNPSPTKLNFVGLAKNKSTGGVWGGGGGGLPLPTKLPTQPRDRRAIRVPATIKAFSRSIAANPVGSVVAFYPQPSVRLLVHCCIQLLSKI